MIQIEHFTFNSFQTRCMVIWDKDGCCVFIDPGFCTPSEKSELTAFVASKGLKPACIMLTHAHFDHIYGVAELMKEYEIPTYMHNREVQTIEEVNPILCKTFGLPVPEGFFADAQKDKKDAQKDKESAQGVIFIKEGNKVEAGSLRFEVIETPGHTVGGVCFLERNEKVLLSGDTLFAGAIGRTDHPGGDYDLIMKSIFEKLLHLDGDIKVFPGHGPATSISDERMTNPFLLPFNEPYEEN